MALRTTICHLTFSPVLLAPPRRPLDSGPESRYRACLRSRESPMALRRPRKRMKMVGRRAVRQGGLAAGPLALRTRAGIYSPSPQSSAVKGEEEHHSGWPSIVGCGQAPALDKPQRYISPSTLGCRCSGEGGWCRRPVPECIPDRSPGHAFLPIYRGGIIKHIELFQILRVRTGTRTRSRQIRY